MRLRWHRKDPQPVVAIRKMMVENGAIDVEWDTAPEIVAGMFAALAKLLHDAPNYVESSVTIKPKNVVEPFTITVQRAKHPTPHTMRRKAEEALRDLHRAIDMHHVAMCNCGDPAGGNHTAGGSPDKSLWSHYRGDLAYPDVVDNTAA